MTAQPGRYSLSAAAAVEGRGLFTERAVRCVIRPAPTGAGVVFVRADLPGGPGVVATIDALGTQPVHPAFARIPPRHTVLASAEVPGCVVFTTEHVLAALAGLGVTDAVIELDAPELPIGDGSAKLFTDAIAKAGIAQLDEAVEPLTVAKTVVVESPDGSASIRAEPLGPAETPTFRYELDYGPGSPIPAHAAAWDARPDTFVRDIAPARTFSLAAEAAQMRALGMFKTFTPRDLLVIDDNGSPMDNSWRFADEPARHKLLDLIGDLALIGRPLCARVTSTRGGHALNHAMAWALLAGD